MPTRPRPSWLAALVGLALLAAPAGAALAAEAPAAAQVEIAAVGPDGLAGLALLAPAEGGTSVQLLVVGAPAGTTAVVHAGSCAAIDPAPVGLLGDVGAGQLQAALPLPPEALGDGGHVIVLHPGLDLATALGCGAIPALAAAPAPSAPAAVISASAPPDPACEGVAAWAEATEGRLAELGDLAAEADRLAGLFDLPGYLAAIGTFADGVQSAATDQQTGSVPAVAVEANGQAMAAYATMLEAASLFVRYYTMEMTPEVIRQASSTYDQAVQMADDVRRETSRLTAMCEGP